MESLSVTLGTTHIGDRWLMADASRPGALNCRGSAPHQFWCLLLVIDEIPDTTVSAAWSVALCASHTRCLAVNEEGRRKRQSRTVV